MWPSMNCRSLKTAKNLRINITENVIKTSFIVSFSMERNYLFIYSTTPNVFRDVFYDVYLRSFKVLHFRRGDVVIEAPINFAK